MTDAPDAPVTRLDSIAAGFYDADPQEGWDSAYARAKTYIAKSDRHSAAFMDKVRGAKTVQFTGNTRGKSHLDNKIISRFGR